MPIPLSVVFLLGTALLTGCTMNKQPPPVAPAPSPEWARLQEIEASYEAWRHPLAIASWHESLGETQPQKGDLKSQRRAFFFDSKIDAQLKPLTQSYDPKVKEVANAWLRLRASSRLTYDERLDDLRISIERLATGGADEPARMAPVQTLYTSTDPAAREAALKELEDRFGADLLPLLQWRAERLDELARGAGYKNYLEIRFPNPKHGPRAALEGMCTAQITASQPAWDRFVLGLTEKLGRAPTHADYLAEAVSGTNANSQFLAALDPHTIAKDLFKQMGFKVDRMNIQIEHRKGAPGGTAHAIDPPRDVRLEGLFPPGYDGTRGYLHELGHAVHLSSISPGPQPFRQLPQNLALAEGIAEVFVRGLRDPGWLKERFPEVSQKEFHAYLASIENFEAYAVREYCLLAQVEMAIAQHRPIDEAFASIYETTFGVPHAGKPFYDLVPYLTRPLYSLDYVVARSVTDAIITSLAPKTLLSPKVGDRLRREVFEPGNTLELADIILRPKTLLSLGHSIPEQTLALGF